MLLHSWICKCCILLPTYDSVYLSIDGQEFDGLLKLKSMSHEQLFFSRMHIFFNGIFSFLKVWPDIFTLLVLSKPNIYIFRWESRQRCWILRRAFSICARLNDLSDESLIRTVYLWICSRHTNWLTYGSSSTVQCMHVTRWLSSQQKSAWTLLSAH